MIVGLGLVFSGRARWLFLCQNKPLFRHVMPIIIIHTKLHRVAHKMFFFNFTQSRLQCNVRRLKPANKRGKVPHTNLYKHLHQLENIFF